MKGITLMQTKIEEKNLAKELGRSGEYAYRAVRERLYKPELGHYVSYGIEAYRRGGEAVSYVSDVSCDERFVRQLAESFTEGGLAPIQLADAIEDAIP